MLSWLIRVWTAYAHRATTYQSVVLLTIVYLLVLGPAAVVARILGARLLDLRRDTSSWVARGTQDASLDALRRQF